jgi:hypothetical protein
MKNYEGQDIDLLERLQSAATTTAAVAYVGTIS